MDELITREPTEEELAEFERMDKLDPDNVAPLEVIELGNY